ncbi:MAG: hypothetical protein ACK4TH_12895, partial [Tepidimonas sp.]
ELGIQIKGMKFSVLGFGNVGSWTARIFQDLGAKLVAVMDHTGGIRNTNGIDAHALSRHVAKVGGVAGFGASSGSGKKSSAGAEKIDADEFYKTPVDVLVPAALEQMIKDREARMIAAKGWRRSGCRAATRTPSLRTPSAMARSSGRRMASPMCGCAG